MANESQVLKVSTDAIGGRLATSNVALSNSSGVAIFQAAKFNLGGDMWIYWGSDAPVDYTDGDPAATGEAEAGIGSIYIRTSNGKQYQNGGTKAQPIWKLVTSAA